ncbi:phage virion morphogenesis protein [Klebsiella pneumoniae]|uniref:phage virion morphogenesis protein n=1 Tax=Klebsiella pneumoniae TaxID=573 RepID=UPI00191D80F8|nr:phage virion morphogenesis protein [Klebsiella pneumoniae]MBL0838835.1 phage virion morphogenesis protein [Klebsiella pneumoniae]MDX4863318.1 phage virion morphogenesis protein [Klebsiella pneumoniae]
MSDRMFSELDQVFQDILDGVSPAGRTRTARKIGLALRRSQQRRIASQKNPDGSRYTARRRKVYRTQQGIKFVWNNEVRALKNWRGGRGKYGRTITGFDEKRSGIRTFYRADIERYLEIKTQSATQTETKKAPMFTRLRTLRFMKVRPDAGGVTVGFDGIAARIARIHQYGLQDEVGPGAYAQYPARELLGMTPADLIATENAVISSLGGVS